jgi:hypothetical protein
LPGTSATVLEMMAVTGGMPVASRTGKVTIEAPPITVERIPPMTPAPSSRMMWKKSITARKRTPE